MTQASPAWIAIWLPLFWWSCIAWIVSEVCVLARDLRRVRGANADRGSFWGLVVLLNLAIWGAAWARVRLPGAAMHAPEPAAIIAAVALMWLGITFRIWSVLTLGAMFRVTVVVQEAHRLVTRGPYSRLRHPSYAGALATMFGFGLAMANWASLGLMIVLPALAFGWRVRAEEAALRGRFGAEYAAYAGRTWAVVPFIW